LSLPSPARSTQPNPSNQIKSNQIKSNQIKSDQIKSNQIKSDQIKSNQIKSNQIKSNQIKSNQIKSNQIESNQIKSNQIKSNRIESNQINTLGDPGRPLNKICARHMLIKKNTDGETRHANISSSSTHPAVAGIDMRGARKCDHGHDGHEQAFPRSRTVRPLRTPLAHRTS
jgi:hypothetical protein